MTTFPIFEALMLICFGSAWPFSIVRSYRSRTNRGKSLLFLCILDAGYAFGIVHKWFWALDVVIALYILNFTLVTVDILLYLRNRRFDRQDG